MTRLGRYLSWLFTKDALSLFAVAAFLVWITQALRLFDLVTAKGQDMLTLLGQSALTTPPLAQAIIYICMGIGMARALRALQTSRELHIIHSSGRIRALWGAVALFVVGGVVAVSLLANWIEPWSKRVYAQWSEQVAADLVGRALTPHRFSEVVPNLVVVIGGREPDGTIVDFFADDKRDPDSERTYVADSATIGFDDDGYNISLGDGAVQYVRKGNRFTEVGFSKYQLSLDRLAEAGSSAEELDQKSTLEILSGRMNKDAWREINNRLAEVSRLIALCLLVACITAFPKGHRGRDYVPIEVLVLGLGLSDRVIGSIAVAPLGALGEHLGAMVLLGAALAVLLVQIYGARLPELRWRPA